MAARRGHARAVIAVSGSEKAVGLFIDALGEVVGTDGWADTKDGSVEKEIQFPSLRPAELEFAARAIGPVIKEGLNRPHKRGGVKVTLGLHASRRPTKAPGRLRGPKIGLGDK